MNSEIAEMVGGAMYASPECRAYPKIIVHSVVQTLIQKPDPLLETTMPCGPRLRPDIAIVADELTCSRGNGDQTFNHTIDRIDQTGMAINELCRGMALIGFRDSMECMRRESIITVEPPDDLSRRAPQ